MVSLEKLFQLPTIMVQTILGEWLSTEDLSSVDLSIGGSHREYFLELISDICFSTCGINGQSSSVRYDYNSYLDWLIKRKIKVRHLHAEYCSDVNRLLEKDTKLLLLLESCCLNMYHSPMGDTRTIQCLLRHAHNLTHLTITKCHHHFYETPPHFPPSTLHHRVQSLTFSDSRGLVDHFASALLSLFPHLKALHFLGCTTLTTVPLPPIKSLTIPLRELNLSGSCNVSSSNLLSLLQHCPRLEALDLSSSCLALMNADDLSIFADTLQRSCFSLASLDLSRSAVTDDHLSGIIRREPPLKSLRLSHCRLISDTSLSFCEKHTPMLTHLDVSWCPLVSGDSVSRLCLNGKLQKLNVVATSAFTENVFSSLTLHCRALSSLECCGDSNLTDTGLNNFLEGVCTRIETLSLVCTHSSQALTDVSLRNIGQRLQSLRCLHLNYLNSITSSALVDIARGCPLLSDLSVSACNQLCDDGVLAVLYSCRLLQELNVSYCDLLSDRVLLALSTGVEQGESCLRSLDISCCSRFSDVGLEALVRALHVLVGGKKARLKSIFVTECEFSDRLLSSLFRDVPGLLVI